MNPIAYSSNKAIDILQAVGGRMKSGIHMINDTTIKLMSIYMDEIINILFDSNGYKQHDPILYINKSKKKTIYH